MRKAPLFAIVLAVGLVAFVASTAWYLSVYRAPNNSWYDGMDQMWGGMMNGDYYGGMSYGMAQYIWVIMVPVVAMIALGFSGLTYYLVYPEIRRSSRENVAGSGQSVPSGLPVHDSVRVPPSTPTLPAAANATQFAYVTSSSETTLVEKAIPDSGFPPTNAGWPVLMKTARPDERKVLEVLACHNGTQLQKYIVKESGLSKLRTHRTIARLEERGIVRVTESGNTNLVTLAEWLGHPEIEKPEPKTSVY